MLYWYHRNRQNDGKGKNIMGKIHKFDTVWGKLQDNKNIELRFQCEIESYKEVVIELVAKDIYNLFVNGIITRHTAILEASNPEMMEKRISQG